MAESDTFQTRSEHPFSFRGHPGVIAVSVLLLCLGATFFFVRELKADGERMRADAFEYRAADALARIDTRLRRFAQLLRGAAAFVSTSDATDPRLFDAYTDALQLGERYPEIQAFGLAVAQDTATPAATVLHVRRSIGEAVAQHGVDLYSTPAMRDAMARAQDRASTALSAILPAEPGAVDANPHFAVIVPFFERASHGEPGAARDRAAGWLFAEVSTYAMMHRLFGENAADDMQIRIRDGIGAQSPFLYGTADATTLADAPSDLVVRRALAFGDHEWTVEVRATPAFAGGRPHDHVPLLAAASAGSSVLLASFTWLLATSRRRAQKAAEGMNRELIDSESRLRELNEDLERRVARRTQELASYAERLALAVETSNTGLWDWNLASRTVHYSKEWARQLGLEQEELNPSIDEWESRLHPEDRDAATHAMCELTSRASGPCEMELRLRHRDGSYRTIVCRAQCYADASGRPARIVGSHLDITQRKRTEENLLKLARELRHSWRQLSHVEETERRWLASELHDSIGSALTALSLNLAIVRDRLTGEARVALQPRLQDSLGLVEETVDALRGMMAQLRPPVLDDYGIATALRWYVGQIATRGNIDGTFRLAGEDVRLPSETEIVLFRIAQEALANVMKHSGAKHVEVTMEVASGSVRVSIVDDGRGFVPDKVHADAAAPHWGLITLRERAESVGGRCTIESHPGRGTRVTVEVPRSA